MIYMYVGIAYNRFFVRGDLYYALSEDKYYHRLVVVNKFGDKQIVNKNQFKRIENEL